MSKKNTEELQEKVEAVKTSEELQAEVEALKKQLEAATAPAATPEKTVEEYLEERVPVFLIKDADKYKDDVMVAVNGERILIQRGVQVFVKRKFALILESQYRQQLLSAALIAAQQSEFRKNSGSL